MKAFLIVSQEIKETFAPYSDACHTNPPQTFLHYCVTLEYFYMKVIVEIEAT